MGDVVSSHLDEAKRGVIAGELRFVVARGRSCFETLRHVRWRVFFLSFFIPFFLFNPPRSVRGEKREVKVEWMEDVCACARVCVSILSQNFDECVCVCECEECVSLSVVAARFWRDSQGNTWAGQECRATGSVGNIFHMA